ncbi:hypothetical protein [Propionicimonas sp.]|uniref:pilus assembly protein TadG-related protein n=1 Tax=Propionicimonas sp. TaxID=1955623 RepID=UPI00184BF165|nr:hypothetical protein [Propionicimonas sp.]MBU3977302.1 hypothetical protein [Actinomycetota bacterium]MBA3021227.1 hypothetical protein [Propionicimonas sp.]MBU3985812.1 hypothetical protein [Actinomycetota bacterium]MBU4008597.1 hypothetical protein [Actinomycetota bacterium]MBU4066253.1 hypothetical protein [Actinomycetota bacterium]
MGSQRGMSLSPFIAVLLPALLVMIGLVVDGGAQAAAANRAERIAAAAARAASDDTAAARLAGGQLNVAHAITVAQQRVAAETGVSAQVSVQGGQILVRTKVVTATTLLNLIGINELTATGSAQAQLTADR